MYDVPLSGYTSWRVGGAAKRFYRPADSGDLVAFLQQLDGAEPLLWLGLGSNLLVRDGGFNGTVICTLGALERLELLPEGVMCVEAGVPCAKVARFATRNGRVGIEFLAGIPGTMGGALAMNAGAFGGDLAGGRLGGYGGPQWLCAPARSWPVRDRLPARAGGQG